MYCKNCGKALNAGDKFCSNCGTKVEEEFVPAFRQEERPVREQPAEEKPSRNFTIEKFDWDLDGYPTDHKKTEEINFNWDSVLEEKQRNIFSSEAPKRPVTPVTQEAPKGQEEPESGEADAFSEEESLENAIFADIGTLKGAESTKVVERVPSKSRTIDKFYTFNKKNEEFQALLDQEYERIKNGQSDGPAFPEEKRAPKISSGSRHEEFDWTLPGGREPSGVLRNSLENEKEDFAGFVDRPSYVGVVLASTPEGYMEIEEEHSSAQDFAKETEAALSELELMVASAAARAEKKLQLSRDLQAEEAPVQEKAQGAEPEKEENAQKADGFRGGETQGAEKAGESESSENQRQEESDDVKKEQSKLTFVDVFADDDDDAEKPKKGKALKVIAAILCILVIAELVMIGIQYFAPESKAAGVINNAYSKVAGLIKGDDEQEEQEPAEPQTEESEIAQLIEAKKDLGKNIATVEEEQSLAFEDGKDYGFEGFSNAYTFADKPWYTDEDGNSVTYGEEIIGTVIGYYSSWVDKINGKNKKVLNYVDDTSEFYADVEALKGKEDVQYGINRLAIGEIRAGSAGFFVFVSVTKVDSDSNEETAEKQIIYMEPANKAMKIVDIKEI